MKFFLLDIVESNCRNVHFGEKGTLNKWVFEKGIVFYTDISYWRLFPLPWTFSSYIFSWHNDLSSLPISPFTSQPLFFFSHPQGTGVPWGSTMEIPLFSSYLFPSVLIFFHSFSYYQHIHGWVPERHDLQFWDSFNLSFNSQTKTHVFFSLLSFICVFTLAW